MTAMVAGAAIACAACEEENLERPTTGSPPVVGIPVGPPPGPGLKRELVENPFENDPVAREAGRKLFVIYNCAGCHGAHGGGGMGPTLRDRTWRYGSTPAAIFDSIAEGRGHGMPAWGLKVPEEQLWKLVTYIESMRTAKEPSPPDQTIPSPVYP